jgi:hypothetical protein
VEVVPFGELGMRPNMADFNDKYENLGTVTVVAPPGADPMSPELLDKVRPEACKLGGAALTLMFNHADTFHTRHSVETTSQQTLQFDVWGPRVNKPVAF